MDRQDSRTDLGAIKIHKNTIASIAYLAALEVEGVKRVGTSCKNNLWEIFAKKAASKIKVEIDKYEDIRLEIPLIVKYNFNIPDISARVQENVRNALEKMTNLSIKDINISVLGIEKDQEKLP